MRHSLLLCLLPILGCSSAISGNLFPEDTSFETGTQNFRYYRSEHPIRTVQNDAAHGKSSLEIDSSVSWAQGLWTYSIKKDTDYTVSFYARRVSGGNRLTFTMIGVIDWKQIGGTTFRLTDKWQRYSCRIRTNRAGTVLYPAFLPKEKMVFRIDAIQLEQGTATSPYHAGEPFSLFPSVNGAGEVVHTPAIPKMTIHAFNSDISAEYQPFMLRFTIPGTGIHREQTFRLKQGETVFLTCELPEASLPGYYPAELRVCDRQGKIIKHTAAPFVVTEPFGPPSRDGFFGMQDTPLPRSFLHRIGTSHIRSNDFGWKRFEPAKGKYRDIPPSPPAGFFWQPTINKDFCPGHIPAWGLKPGSRLADPQKAIPYLEYVFRNLQGKAEYLDFINEPDLMLRDIPGNAEYYVELLNTAAPIAHKYGIKLMIDTSGVKSAFFTKVMRLAHQSVDICAPHPYCSPRIFAADGRFCAPPEKGGFTTMLASSAEQSRKYGKELVIGELGYSLEETIPFHAPEAHRMAAYLARMFLIARTYPDCRYLIWFLGLDRWEAGPYCYGIWRTANGIRPLPSVAAYAQAAHEIDRAESAEMLLDSDIKIVRYKKDNRISYAVWNAGEKNEPIPLSTLPADCNARSIYGTPLKPAELAITESPLYLSENPEGTVLPGLQKTIDKRSPVSVRCNLRSLNSLKLHFFNRSFRNWKGTLSVPPFLSGVPLEVPRQSLETVTIGIKGTPPSVLPVKIRGSDGRTFEETICLPLMRKVRHLTVNDLRTFDFQTEMKKGETIRQDSRDHVYPPDPSIPWSGPQDLSHSTLLGWDHNYFYLFSEVRDEVHCNPFSNGNIWKGDSLQIGLDCFNDADGKLAYDSDDYEFTFAKDKKAWVHHAPPFRNSPEEAVGVRQIITRNEAEKTTVYRIAIPRNLLEPLKLKEGTVFGLAFCINDLDPEKSRRSMNFGGGIVDIKCPGRFIKMVLGK